MFIEMNNYQQGMLIWVLVGVCLLLGRLLRSREAGETIST
jgi:hypothetical protein